MKYGIPARNSSYKSGLLASGDDKISKGLVAMLGIWFEMRATDDEKKKIWKKMKNNQGKKLDIYDILGDSQEMSWENLYESTDKLKQNQSAS
ncbi:hypothetical protein [Nitrosopumilus sp.]|uniref:hypothetical protein n=1 Tax=Nitrosopumilus sp. TaxID=2024843 RepID=UPI0034A014BB